jgi:predicted transcriptional regulator
MTFFFNRGKGRGIPRTATFRITQEGEAKLENQFSSDPRSKILSTLETEGSLNIDEIARVSSLSRGKVEKTLEVLVGGGYVQYVGRGSGVTSD